MALGARCLPTVGSYLETSLPVSDTIYVVAEDDEKAEEEVMKLGGGG